MDPIRDLTIEPKSADESSEATIIRTFFGNLSRFEEWGENI